MGIRIIRTAIRTTRPTIRTARTPIRTLRPTNEKTHRDCSGFSLFVPGRIRTSDLLIRSQPLYPAELRALLLEASLKGPTNVTANRGGCQPKRRAVLNTQVRDSPRPIRYTQAMIAALGVALPVWALVCLAVYSALRWMQTRVPGGVLVVGFFVFGVQLLVMSCFLIVMAGPHDFSMRGQPPPPAPPTDWPSVARFTASVLAIWLLPMLLSAKLMQLNPQRKVTFSARFLFCALLFPVATGASWFVLLRLGLYYPAVNAYTTLLLRSRNHVLWEWAFCFLVWTFPLGAPLAEVALRSFRRAAETNATGSRD